MDFKYNFILKKIVCNKLRNIYIRVNSKSRKQYLKYKGEMINIKEYKSNFKNINKKKYKKIKGGDNEFNEFINDIKLITFPIYPLPDAPDAPDAPEKLDPLIQFHHAYLNFVKKLRKEDEEDDEDVTDKEKQEEHLNFLTTLLTYLKKNFNLLKRDDKKDEYKLLLEKLSVLLHVIEQQGITGIHNYTNDTNSEIPYVSNKSKYFDEIISVINYFRIIYNKIAWTKFQKKTILNKEKIEKEEITISNSAVQAFIVKMISTYGLDEYNSNHNTPSSRRKSAKPYSKPFSDRSKTGNNSSKPFSDRSKTGNHRRLNTKNI